MAIASGTLIGGDFRVERELGKGGMGQVYVATQLSTGRRRALKVMRADLVEDPKLRQRFEQEAKVGARIASDHVVEVIAAGVDEATGMPWLAMELLEGSSLAELVDRGGPLSASEASVVLGHVAHALEAAHQVGVVHRDLKPENVFVSRPKRASETRLVKVLDFGIAKVVAEARSTATAPVGTLLWMAPEQAESEGAIGPSTDVWSFGLLTFYVLTGRALWKEDASPARLMRSLIVDDIPKASVRAREIGADARLPPDFDAWFARCVAREPSARFASLDEANRELQPMLGAAHIALAETMPKLPTRPPAANKSAPTIAAPTVQPAATRRASLLGGLGVLAAVVGIALAARHFEASPHTTTDASSAMASTAPTAAVAPAASSAKFSLDPDDDEDHETVWRVPLEDSPRRGGKEPLVTIVEFADFECPYARKFEETEQRLLKKYGDDVAIVWKNLILDLHPIAEPAARLAILARADLGDDAFWRLHDQLFSACSENDVERVVRAGEDIGLAPSKARAAMDGPSPAVLDRDCELAFDVGAMSTPTMFFNGRRVGGWRSLEELTPLVEQEMAKAKALLAAGVPRAKLYDELQKSAVAKFTLARHVVEIPAGDPVLEGAHAVVDVHEFGDEAHYFTVLLQPIVDVVLREYGDRIRFHWHWLPTADAGSRRVAFASEAIFNTNGNEVFWKFHRQLVDNYVFPFPFKTAGARRGQGDDALEEFARRAGASPLYGRNDGATTRYEKSWDEWRALAKKIDPDSDTGVQFLYAGGYELGHSRRAARRILDMLLAEAAKGSK